MTAIKKYHQSIGHELQAAAGRVRNLLEPTEHWGEDGRHKEGILKDVITRHVPKSISVYSGFVRVNEGSSGQIDILLTHNEKPMLYQSNDFCITTPSSVFAMVEVKTRIASKSKLKEAVERLAENAKLIRENVVRAYPYCASEPWAGLFVYDSSDLRPRDVLDVLADVAGTDFARVIQLVCLGPDQFYRYWAMKRDEIGAPSFVGWEAYKLTELAFSYFISNLLWQDRPMSKEEQSWFPLREGKNPHRVASKRHEYRPRS